MFVPRLLAASFATVLSVMVLGSGGAFAADSAPAAAAAETAVHPLSIAIVDMRRVLGMTDAAKDIQSQVEAKRKLYQDEISKLEKELSAGEKDLAGQKDKLSADEFGKKRGDLEKKFQAGQKIVLDHKRSLEYGLSSSVSKLETEAGDVIADIAGKRGFTIVMSREGIVLAEKALDITEDVVAAVNKKISKIKISWTPPAQ